MEAHQVVPDVLDVAPKSVATVKYQSGVEMNLGNVLTPFQVKDVPHLVTWSDVDSGALYTVLFTDPDAPSRQNPALKEVLHWMVVNASADISSGDTIMEYIGSGPPDATGKRLTNKTQQKFDLIFIIFDTGLHRYILTIFKQPSALPVDELKAAYPPTARLKFNSRNFIAKYSLGVPVAGNFYQASFDEHVRERRGQRLSLAFKAQEIVPDVVDVAPVLTIEVKFASGSIMNIGAEMTPAQVKTPEYLSWRVEEGALYTLCLTDPDAPSRSDPKFREFVHWLVVNIKGSLISSGQTLVKFTGSNPGAGTGLHRYCLLLYKQPGQISPDFKPVTDETSREGRRSFRIREFATKYGLQGPVAGNFYLAQSQ